jgi:Subtilase family
MGSTSKALLASDQGCRRGETLCLPRPEPTRTRDRRQQSRITHHPIAAALTNAALHGAILMAALLVPSSVAVAQDVVQPGQQTPPGPAPAPGNRSNPFGNRYVITFAPGMSRSGRAQAARDAGAQLRHNFVHSNAIAVTVPNENALNAFRNNRSVVSVVPEGVVRIFAKRPDAPTSLAAAVDGAIADQIDLTWADNSNNEGAFEVARCSGVGCGGFSTIATVPANTTTFQDAGLAPGSYSYHVRATPAGNGPSSSWSNTATAAIVGANPPPAAPSSAAAAATSDTTANVGWVDNADGEDGFEIERCTGSGCTSFASVGTVGADTTLYADAGLTASTAYRYRVRAFNGNGNSAYSNSAGVTTAAPPGPPLPPPPNERGNRQQPADGVVRVGLPTATSNGQGIGIAVLDTGIYFAHEDLAPAPDVPGVYNPLTHTFSGTSYNGSNEGQSANDTWGHGTHVAGRIAALDNNYGVVGVAPKATLYAVKVDADPQGQIAESDIIAGLEWIIDRANVLDPPIRVVNISSGGPFTGTMVDEDYHNRIIDLYNMGIVVVVSAGNDPSVEVSALMPAAWPETITVAATVASDGLGVCDAFFAPADTPVLADTAASFTTDGPGVDVSAPGAERSDAIGGCTGLFYGTLSTVSPRTNPPLPGEEYGTYGRKIPAPLGWIEARGTSFSAPLVAGVAARILQLQPTLDVEGVRQEIKNLADRVGEAPLDHPWAGSWLGVNYTFDGIREGIAQAPR